MAISPSYSLNNPSPISGLRKPRGFVSINQIQVPWEKFEVSQTRYTTASTFKITIPVSSLPKNLQLKELIQTAPLTVQINAGLSQQSSSSNLSPTDLPMIILGDADDIVFNPLTTSIEISGRDYISKFIDRKVMTQDQDQVSMDQTSSQLITKLTNLQDLTPVVTSTSTQIGKYIQDTNIKLSVGITQWDLMTFLARQEGFDIFVKGTKLYFQPSSKNATPYQITLTTPYYSTPNQISTSNTIEVSFSRNLRLARNIIVTVNTWNYYNQTSYQSVATLTNQLYGGPDTLAYNYTFANLSKAQTDEKAQSLLKQISQHEMTCHVRMPADPLITAQTVLSVKDTNTLFDQTYYVKNVIHEMNINSGYIMTIESKNQTPYRNQTSSVS